MSIPIHFAPLQGYTDDVYRRIHHELIGGIETYYTPFLRMEGGGVRTKDMRDIRPVFNEGIPVVPQIILKTMKEFDYLTSVVEEKGYTRIDINMGCPFPCRPSTDVARDFWRTRTSSVKWRTASPGGRT